MELESRLARLELVVRSMREELERRQAAIQAQLDHLLARFNERR